jgi:hypothetical protein
MKKPIKITMSVDILEFLETNFINKSAFIEALIRKYMHQQSINIPLETKVKPSKTDQILDPIKAELDTILQAT